MRSEKWNSGFDIFIVMRWMVRLQHITYVYIDFNQYKIKLFDIDLNKYDNDNKFIKERHFEVILTSFSSSNDYRPLLNYK